MSIVINLEPFAFTESMGPRFVSSVGGDRAFHGASMWLITILIQYYFKEKHVPYVRTAYWFE